MSSRPEIDVVVAGRRIEAAQRTARQVDHTGTGRVTAAQVDIESHAGLDGVLADADVCLVALPGQVVTANLIEAMIRNRTHYVDLSPTPHLESVLHDRASAIEQAGLAIMRQAGLLPGTAAPIARYAAHLIEEPTSVEVDTFLQGPELPDAGVADLLEGIRSKPSHFVRGESRPASPVAIAGTIPARVSDGIRRR